MSQNLKSKFISGLLWTSSSNIGAIIINFTLGVWLARILGPEAYGIIAMIIVVTGFSRLFLDFGFGEALIQNLNTSTKDFSTIFWYNLISALLFSFIIFYSSNLISAFYKNFELTPYIKVMSSIVFLNSISMVQKVKLEKEMQFKQIGIAEFVSTLLSYIVAIYYAYYNLGVWSLVILHLTKPLFYSILIWWYSKWVPNLYFSFFTIKKYLNFSFAIFINGVFDTISTSIDRLLIGRYLGELSLGIYSKSLSTVRMPVNTFMSAISRVFFPVFSKIQNDKYRVFKIYNKFIFTFTGFICLFALVFYFFGSEIILLVFGEKWRDMIPIFKIFSLGLIFLPFNKLIDIVIKSIGKTNYLHLITFIEKPILILSLCIGIFLGEIYYVAVMFNFSIILNFFVKSYIMTLGLGQSFKTLIFNHFYSLRIILLPLLALFIIFLTENWNNIIVKLLSMVIPFLISLYLFRESSVYPVIKLLYNKEKN